MAKGRLLAKVGVSGKKGELVYYKDGNLYAVKAKRGGTKGHRTCKSSKPKATVKRKTKAKSAKRRKR